MDEKTLSEKELSEVSGGRGPNGEIEVDDWVNVNFPFAGDWVMQMMAADTNGLSRVIENRGSNLYVQLYKGQNPGPCNVVPTGYCTPVAAPSWFNG